MEQKSNNQLACAVDLGGTNLRAANIDRDGRIYEHFKTRTPETSKVEEIVSAIVTAVRECEANAAKRGANIHTVSVVVPGSVQAETGVVVNAPNIPSLPGFELAAALKEALGRTVLLENDANAAALGEMWQGAARNCKTIVCLTLGTGVGGAIILDGKLWRGVDGTAGEIGHTTVEPFGGLKCKCGSVGCLEVYASATATYGVGVWTDAQNATVCVPVQTYRAASLAAGQDALPAPWPLADCPATFGNTDIWSATTG